MATQRHTPDPTLTYSIRIREPRVYVGVHPDGCPDVLRVSADMTIEDPSGTTVVRWREESVEEAIRDLQMQTTFALGNDLLVERDFQREGVSATIYGADPRPVELVMTDRAYTDMVEAVYTSHVAWCDAQPDAPALQEERGFLSL